MRSIKLLIPLTILILFLSINVFADSGTFSETYQAKESVQIKAELGSLELKSWDRNEILVECDYDLSGELYIDPIVRDRKNRLTIKGEVAGRYRNSYNSSVQWTLTVPVGTEVNFESTSGSVNIKDFNGDFDGSTASGEIEILNSKGNFEFNTASGAIEISDSEGEFNLNTASGKISSDRSKGIFNLNSASGRVSINDITLDGESFFSTASGNAFVSLAKSAQFDIAVSSASGDATLDFNGNEIAGFIEMRAQERRGDIKCPFDFDDVKYEHYRNNRDATVIKSVTIGNDLPVIAISTGSGQASLKK